MTDDPRLKNEGVPEDEEPTSEPVAEEPGDDQVEPQPEDE